MPKPIYLDYAASTPLDPQVLDKMKEYMELQGVFGNPSSEHFYGLESQKAIEKAREYVADLIGAKSREIIWTSGATEANNLAIKGAAYFYQHRGKHIVTCQTEHKAVLQCCEFLEKQGFSLTYLKPNTNGLVSLSDLEVALRDDTILVSIMHVNNETGVIQAIDEIGSFLKQKSIIFHVDAAQSAGKVPIDVNHMNVDLMSLSGHKIYGPKGVGALYVRHKPRVRLQPLLHGGDHEQGLRSGTLATHQIVGMGEAFRLASLSLDSDGKKIQKLRDQLWNGIKDLPGIHLNSDSTHSFPGILNVSFNYIDGEALLMSLRQLAVSTGSACNSSSISPSHVLLALDIPDYLAHSAVRISFGRFTTTEEMDSAIQIIHDQVIRLLSISPLFDGAKA